MQFWLSLPVFRNVHTCHLPAKSNDLSQFVTTKTPPRTLWTHINTNSGLLKLDGWEQTEFHLHRVLTTQMTEKGDICFCPKKFNPKYWTFDIGDIAKISHCERAHERLMQNNMNYDLPRRLKHPKGTHKFYTYGDLVQGINCMCTLLWFGGTQFYRESWGKMW
jgi:hypothetical protein